MIEVLLWIYFSGLAVWVIGMGIYYGANQRSPETEQRNLARAAVLAPVWFLAVPGFLLRGLKVIPWLWKKADWRNAQMDYEKKDDNFRGGSRLSGW